MSHRKVMCRNIQRSHQSSHVPYKCLSDEEKVDRLRNLHESLKRSQCQVKYLHSKLQALLEEKTVMVDSSLHEDLYQIIKEESSSIFLQ